MSKTGYCVECACDACLKVRMKPGVWPLYVLAKKLNPCGTAKEVALKGTLAQLESQARNPNTTLGRWLANHEGSAALTPAIARKALAKSAKMIALINTITYRSREYRGDGKYRLTDERWLNDKPPAAVTAAMPKKAQTLRQRLLAIIARYTRR